MMELDTGFVADTPVVHVSSSEATSGKEQMIEASGIIVLGIGYLIY